MPGAGKYRTDCIVLAHLAALSRVPAVTGAELGLDPRVLPLWGHGGHSGGSHVFSLPSWHPLSYLAVPLRPAVFLWHRVPVCTGRAVLMLLMTSLAGDVFSLYKLRLTYVARRYLG